MRLKPRFPDIIHNLGLAFSAKNDSTQASLYFGYAAYRQGKYPEAIFHYNNFLENATGDEDFYIALADCYECHNQPEEAIAAYQKGISLYPHATDLYLSFVRSLQNFGRTEEAVQVLNEALFLFPNDLCVKLENQRIIPIVYKNLEQIDIYRQRFSQKLDEIIQHATLETSEAKKKALSALNRGTNFYLQYQGKNDLELQKKYGQFVHQVMASNYPQWIEPLEMPPAAKDGKIRIGYLSACLQWHTVGMVFLGWLRRCNRQQFEVYCYYIEQEEDDVTHLFRLYSDRFYHIPENLEAICKQIISNRVHVLVFLDIGMAPQMTQLAGLRLAPVQCSAWGHPITSGLPTIDYFLSADLLEPDNAPEHYSEKLIRLPNIGISYSKPEIPQRTKSRSYFGLREDAVVYLSCQSLFKYLPQYDRIFAAIAKEIPQAQFVFVAHKSSQLTDIFRHRLQQAFAKIGLESQEYCLILPRQSKLDYWNLNLVSDIFLDTFSFTGFLTTLESVSCNLPIVTYPGEFMRSRQSSGILKMLGVTGTIAKDEADYIRIAVRLGKDREWRNEIVAQMKQRHPYLYDDRTCIEALEAFYLRIFQES